MFYRIMRDLMFRLDAENGLWRLIAEYAVFGMGEA